MGDINWCLRPLVGFRKVATVTELSPDTGEKKEIWIPGEILALRKDGDEVLFAPTPELPENVNPLEVPKTPAAWAPIGEISVNPVCLSHPEDFLEEEQEEELPTIPQRQGPVVRRRGKE